MKHLFLIILATLIFISGCSESHLDLLPDLEDSSLIDKTLTVEQLHHDMDELVAGALKRHPEMSAYADITKLNKALANYKAEITSPMTRTEFYQVVGKLSHHFGDGHSFLIWPYQELNLLKEEGRKPFPFDVAISTSGEIVFKSTYQIEGQVLLAGTKIESINGVNSKQLLSTMQQYVGGETKYLREQIVARRFAIGLWAVYGFIDEFQLAISNNNQLDSIQVNAKQNWQLQDTPNKQAYYYQTLQTGLGYLYLGHFDIAPDEFEDFVDGAFNQIKQDNISSLIIDIRNNPGGNTDTVTYLTRYFANKPFRLVSSVREKLNDENRGWFNYKGEVGDIISQDWTDWHSPIDSSTHFKGDTYLLVGAVSYSAAIVLATTLKDNDFATLVGEETGGFSNQTAQGNLFNLPNSQLRAYIATRSLVRPSGDLTRKGVVPHYVAYNSIDDIKAKRDAGIERILKLIANK